MVSTGVEILYGNNAMHNAYYCMVKHICPMKKIVLLSVWLMAYNMVLGQLGSGVLGGSFNPANKKAVGEVVTTTSDDIWIVFQDKHNNYWYGSNQHGVYYYTGKRMLHFTTKDGLHDNHILEIKGDQQGNVYVSTTSGITKFDGLHFSTLSAINNTEWKLEATDIWFKGSAGSVYRYDGKALYKLNLPKHYLEQEYYKKYPGGAASPYDVYYIYKDNRGWLWIGTCTLGLYCYDGKKFGTLNEEHLWLTPEGGSFCIRSILEDKTGKYWFCNTNYRYQIAASMPTDKQGNIKYSKTHGLDMPSGKAMYYQTIIEDKAGHIWMQTYQNGIWKYDGKQLTNYAVKDDTTPVKVISMYEDNMGKLWLGTAEHGAYSFNGKTFERFRIQ